MHKERINTCPRCGAVLQIGDDGQLYEVEWWKLLDWSKMKATWDKLSPDLKGKIEEWLKTRGD